MNQQTESFEVLAPSAVEALERANVDIQVATAHRYPRSLELFKKRALSMATIDEESAESCIYTRPVGKDGSGQKFAEGASIRLAEIVAAAYGNIRVASRIIEQTERYVKCEGIAHDLEANYAGKSEVIESTVKRDGKPYSEGQRNVVAKACLAKAYRDAVFKVVPKALCKTVYDAAKAICAGTGKTIEQRQERVRAWLTSMRVSDERVFAALSVKGWADVDDNKLLILTGLKTAISEGDTKIEEAFPQLNQPAPAADAKNLFKGGSSTDAAATTQPVASDPPPVTTGEETPQQQLSRFLGESGVSFDDFRDFVRAKNIHKDPESWASFDDVPSERCEWLKAQTKLLVELVKKFGNVQSEKAA